MNKQQDIYLKLHALNDNSVMIINSSEIVYINVTDGEDKFTTIYTMSDEEERQCNEQPDKIFNQIVSLAKSPNGFIRVHRNTDNSIEYFNLKYFITCGIDEGNDTIVSLKNFIQMCINETPERVYNSIMTAFDNVYAKDITESKKTSQKAKKEEK